MGPKTEQLIAMLDDLILILDQDNQTHWSKWMSLAKSRLLSSDFRGIEKVLGAYGGMGSFNDLYLSKDTSFNRNFGELQNQVWSLATEIKREYEANT